MPLPPLGRSRQRPLLPAAQADPGTPHTLSGKIRTRALPHAPRRHQVIQHWVPGRCAMRSTQQDTPFLSGFR